MQPNPVPALLQIPQAVGTTVGVIFTTLGVLAALYIAISREPRKARADRLECDNRAAEDRRHYDDQMAALQRAEDDRIVAQARKIVPAIFPADLFSENVVDLAVTRGLFTNGAGAGLKSPGLHAIIDAASAER